jgi:hypothetical protein
MSDATRAGFHVGSAGGNFTVSAGNDVVADDKVTARRIMSIIKSFRRIICKIILNILRGETIFAIFLGAMPHASFLIYINFFSYLDLTKPGPAGEQLAGAYERFVLTLQDHMGGYLLSSCSVGAVLSIFMFWRHRQVDRERAWSSRVGQVNERDDDVSRSDF